MAFKKLISKTPKLIGSFILKGPIGFLLSEFSVKILMVIYEAGVLKIDLTKIDKTVDFQKLEYKEAIKKAHEKAKKKAITEEEKEQIRGEYKEALAKFGFLSAG